MILNITNGDYFNRYFLKKLNTQYLGNALPFREAMIQGDTKKEVFSDEFIQTRALALSVSEDFYREKAEDILNLANTHQNYEKLQLWFGKDSFCQLNLLTLLAFLEKIAYQGELSLFIIDDESFAVIERDIKIQLGNYQKLYETILIDKKMPSNFGIIYKKAVELYFDYLSPDGALAQFILKNKEKSEDTLMKELLLRTKEYGLSDSNILSLIQRIL